jgi:para-aminobenzoate synthetase/4-amino-4-deoxychorismate lyase
MTAQPVRQALDFGERPDPARGIFETMLVQDGRLPQLEAHIARMNASAQELYGIRVEPPGGRGHGLIGPVRRLTLVPGRGLTAESRPLAPDPLYEQIAPFVLPGGLGRHKWLDRALLEAVTTAAGPATLPLLIDSDGSVLESTWANILIEERGRLISPPDDGRALPGIGRARLRHDEEPVDLDRLLAADAVVLTSALRIVRLPLRG